MTFVFKNPKKKIKEGKFTKMTQIYCVITRMTHIF